MSDHIRDGEGFVAVASSADVAPGPLAVCVDGSPLVLFRDGDGVVGALPDRCPHRDVPLSRGFVGVFGELVCDYHGWAFASDGCCTRIPPSHATMSPARARLRAREVREHDGQVWVGPDDRAGTVAHSLA